MEDGGNIYWPTIPIPTSPQFISDLYVLSSLDRTYSPAVTTSYFAGMSGETQLGMGFILINKDGLQIRYT
jgi:hypothetical protein